MTGYVLFTLGCIGIAAFTLRTALKASESLRWPSVPGTVTKCSVIQITDRSGAYAPYLELAYSYTVNGHNYEGTRIEAGDRINYLAPLKLERRYPAGKQVTVFYDPARPHACTLTRGIPRGLYLTVAVGGLFAILGLYMIVEISLIEWRAAHPPAPPPAMRHYKIRPTTPPKAPPTKT